VEIKISIVSIDLGQLVVKINDDIFDLDFYIIYPDIIVESNSAILEKFGNKTEFIISCIEKLTKKDNKCKHYLENLV